MLDACSGQRRDRGVDGLVESHRVPVRVVVSGSDNDVVAGLVQVRTDVLAREIADEDSGLADDRDVPVGGEVALENAASSETDRVGDQHHALLGGGDRAGALTWSRRDGQEHGARERCGRNRDGRSDAASAAWGHGTHQPVVSNNVWPVDDARRQSWPVSEMPRVTEFAMTAPAAALAEEVRAEPEQASAVT